MTSSGDVEIVGFSEDFAGAFAELNYEWIEKYFSVEDQDRKILDAPYTYVIEPGGQIFFAIIDGVVAGTVALIVVDAFRVELAKMAVAPKFHGRGIGANLVAACIEFSKAAGMTHIVLESHSILRPALSLYKKHGFVEIPPDPNSLYSRSDIRMELAI
ncbi:MAG: GNAT family N-acetyltransferase [Pyrinomonadaceae bacterium]